MMWQAERRHGRNFSRRYFFQLSITDPMLHFPEKCVQMFFIPQGIENGLCLTFSVVGHPRHTYIADLNLLESELNETDWKNVLYNLSKTEWAMP